jgi:hypothetical protein
VRWYLEQQAWCQRVREQGGQQTKIKRASNTMDMRRSTY